MIIPIRFDRVYSIILPELIDAFGEFIAQNRYILGPSVERFEQAIYEHLGCRHAVGCKSGTHALILALKAAGVRPDDEVITVGNTYYATTEAIRHVGAVPVFVDVDPNLGLLDPAGLENASSDRTRAVIAVHLYGFAANTDEIHDFCSSRELCLIEDCAHAFGSRVADVAVGTESDFACFSFYPTKTLGAFGDAGMVLTRNAAAAERLCKLRYYSDDTTRTHFDPDAEHARLDALQAHLLTVLLRHVNGWIAIRRDHAHRYQKRLNGLPNLRLPLMPSSQEVAFYSFPVFTPVREALLVYLRDRGVHVQVHYPTNLHQLPQFVPGIPPSLPITECHNAQVVNLPTHPSLRTEEIDRVAEVVTAFFCSQNI